MQGHAQARPLRAGGRERRNKDTQPGPGQNRTAASAASAASADASDLRFLLLFCSVMSRQLARSLLSSTPSTRLGREHRHPEHVK